MKKSKALRRITSFILALVLVFTSIGVNPSRAYAKDIDDTLIVPFGLDTAYNAEQGIGFVWGAAGYDLYTVTITSDGGYEKVYEDQTLGYHWYPDDYADGKYTLYLQGQKDGVLSQAATASVTIGTPAPSQPENPSQPETPVNPETPSEPEVTNEVPTYTTVGSDLAVTVEGKHEDWVEWSKATVTPATKGATIAITGYEGYEAYQSRVEAAGFSLESGKNYVISFDILSSKDKKTMVRVDDLANGYSLLTNDVSYEVKENILTHVTVFTGAISNTTANARVFAGLGMIVNDDAYKVGDHTVKIENMSVYEISESISNAVFTEEKGPVVNEEDPAEDTIVIDNDSFLFNGDVKMETYSSEIEGYWGGNSHVDFDFAGGIATIKADSFGWNPWAVQWKLLNMTSSAENNIFAFDVVASSDKSFNVKNEVTGVMETVNVKAGEKYHYVMSVSGNDLSVTFDLTGGAGELQFSNVKFAPVINMEYVDFETYTSEADGGWGGDSGVKFNFKDTVATISSNGFGWNAWAVQWKGAFTSSYDKNTFEFDVTATEDKSIVFKNEGTQVMNTLKLKAGVPYHYTENVDGKTLTFTFDLTGGAGTLTFSNMKFGDVGTVPAVKEPIADSMHNFADATGDYADPGLVKEGYLLIWADEFDGNYGDAKVDANTGLNLENWAYQLGDGTTDCGNTGWGNQELQCYTGNSKNVAVNEDLTGDGQADGMLRITASYEENGYKYANESVKKYTSGRIRTTAPGNTLFTTTYGYVEARIALPEVKGAWPAFWMLPESTEIYGGWPVSGELDILETTGTRKDEACGTLHWGTPAHVYKGSGYVKLDSEVKYFHTYAVDWEPGKITWLYDGKPIHTATDWASAFGGSSDALTFDAPFDMPYYMILNLAVDSGNFGGAANKANFTEDINMYVDYVRVFQKEEGYADSAIRSAGEVNDDWTTVAGKNLIAEITADNLITTGMEDATADINSWYMTTQSDASATGKVVVDENGTVWHKISIGSQGANDYSVQLIGHYDTKKGYVYKVSFDAYADNGMVGKTVNCDTKEWAGWSAGGITQFILRDKPSSYSYTFAEKENFDKCRVEFNIGSVGTGDVYISNVRLEVVDPALLGVSENGREALTDGNMIYNSKFDQGIGHLGFWTVGANTEVSVPRFTLTDLTGKDVKVLDVASMTNYEKIGNGIKYYERRAEIKSVNGSAPSISQDGIPMTADTYTIKLDMYSETDSAVKVAILDEEGNEMASKAATYSEGSGVKAYTFVLTTDKDVENASVKITFAKGTDVQLDNVTMKGANQKSAFAENPLNTESTWGGDNGNGGKLETIVGGTTVSVVNATSGGTWYSPQVVSEDFAIGGNVEYRLSYKIKINGDNNGTYEYAIQENGGSWAFAKGQEKVEMSAPDENGYSTYETVFTSNATIANAHFIFGFGNSAINNATIVLDDFNLSIVKGASSDEGNEDSSETVDPSVFDSADEETEEPEEQPVTPPGQNPNGNPGHNANSNPGQNPDANPGHNPEVNPGNGNVAENNGNHNGNGNNRGGNNGNNGRGNSRGNEVSETPGVVTEDTVTPAVAEEPAVEAAPSVVEDTVVEAVLEVSNNAEITIEEADTPLAPAVENGSSNVLVVVLSIVAAMAVAAGAFITIRARKIKE